MRSPYGLMFHHFCDETKHIKGQGAITKTEFEQILERFADKILSAEVWQERLLNNTLHNGEVCLTFDDGLLCQYDIALPVLEERQIKAFWFPYTGPLDGQKDELEILRYFRTAYFQSMDHFYDAFDTHCQKSDLAQKIQDSLQKINISDYLAQFPFYTFNDRKYRYVRDIALSRTEFALLMQDMLEAYNFDYQQAQSKLWMNKEQLLHLHQSGQIIGLHTHTHPTNLLSLSVDEQHEEFENNANWLKKAINHKPTCVAYPCGNYDQRLLDYLSEQGVKIGFQTKMCDTHTNLDIPRMDHVYALT